MNHVEIMKRIIEDLGKKEFTHREIIQWTNANCPYGVLRQLKKYYEIDYIDESKEVKKFDYNGNATYENIRYRKYKILKKKEKQCQKI